MSDDFIVVHKKAVNDQRIKQEKFQKDIKEMESAIDINVNHFDRDRPNNPYQGLKDVKDSPMGQLIAGLMERFRISNEINQKRFHERGYYFQGRLDATSEVVDALYSILDDIVLKDREMKAKRDKKKKALKKKIKNFINEIVEEIE